MATAGSIVIDLLMRTGMFETDTRRAEKRLRDMQKSAVATGKALGSAIAAGAGVAVAGLSLYMKNSIEAEKVQAQLAARIEDTFGAAGRSLSQLNAQADKLMGLTVFDDEAIGQAQAMVLTFKDIQGTNFDNTIEAATDLATVMGTDLTDAAKTLGKALSDPEKGMGALTKAGLVFTDSERERIKVMTESGKLGEAQAEILKKLEGSMGSAAEAARNTLGGALQALQNSFDNLLEGDAQGGGLQGARDGVEALIETLNDPSVKAGVDQIVGGIFDIAGAAAAAIPKIVAFDEKLQKALGLQGKNGKRQATAADFFGAQGARFKALTSGDKAAFDAASKRAQAGFSGGEVDDFGGVDARLLETADFSGVTTRTLAGGGRSSGGTAETDKKAASTRAAAKATKELTEAEKALQEIMETNAMIDEMTADFRMDQVALEYDKAKALEQSRAAIDDQIGDMEFELSLLGLSNKEREKEIALRYAGAAATSEQRDAIAELSDAYYESNKAMSVWDQGQRALSDAIFETARGTKSLKDAALDMFDSIAEAITRSVADNWAERISGWLKGSTSTGSNNSGGDWIGSLFGAFFGGGSAGGGAEASGSIADLMGGAFMGGMAAGGNVFQNHPYLVGEEGPELFVPRTMGSVLTADAVSGVGARGGVTNNNAFHFDAPTSERTQEQVAGRVAFRTQEATRRNR